VPVDAVVVVAVFGFDGIGVREAVVKEALVIMLPGDAGEPAPFDCLVIVTAGIDMSDFYLLPVAACGGKAVGKQGAVLANGLGGYGNGAVFTEQVRIDDDDWLGFEGFLHIEYTLVLQAVVLPEEIPASFFARSRVPGIIPQMR